MSSDTKLIVGVIIASVGLLIGGIFFLSSSGGGANDSGSSTNVEIKIRDEGYNTKGSENPVVKIIEFSDFECPACKGTAPILQQLIKEYPNEVRLIYQHFPLPQHKAARLAAEAVEATGVQGKFWEMHDLLFVNQKELSEEKIRELAGQIEGLDVEKFNQEFDDRVYKNKVLADLSQGNQLGIDSTPTIFINGVLYKGPRSFENMKQVIEANIAARKSNEVPIATDSALVSEEATGSGE